jgi:transposase
MAKQARPDPKAEALVARRSLNPHPDAVADELFAAEEFFDARDLVQVKYEMVRRARVDRLPVARAARAFGMSRPSFYEAASSLDEGGLPALVPAKPGPKGPHKLTEGVVDHLEAVLAADPSASSAELAHAVAERFGYDVHPRSVERALARRRHPKSGR